MEWIAREYKNIFIVSLKGDLDAVTVPSLEDFLTKTVEKGRVNILLNMEKVFYMSSAGLRLLLSLAKLTKNRNGKLCICCLRDEVADIIRVAGLDKVIAIRKAEQESFSDF
ncbi:anti-sigma factor antagonist [Chlamydia suis]|uniref:Anti-sigma factor antagonist n=1 Tax=Chlamydia suis TaxID=83559 RepID=A0AAQ0EQG5_9CHLA|nr:anti-sigma factor antagonist [Chlamydia suis]MCI5641586.1 anti-sigma factor antagonist [Chlamydia suis]MEB2680700.1 anti-sigma factor antagonist [Chlamydia suis]MEB2682429.1 anti-sigma factor antagonist [Chlamydia suis]MEB2683352.1 anti-sigma factor antagonist [Chlamydia suis]MEB2683406.1 anti-sigma factor antagonist [Chlamydia suis]